MKNQLLLIIFALSVSISFSKCAPSVDELCQNMEEAYANQDFDKTMIYANQVFDKLSECTYNNAIDLSFLYYLVAHEFAESQNVIIWLERAQKAIIFAQENNPYLAEEYFLNSFDDNDYSIDKYVANISAEIEYIKNGGNIAFDNIDVLINESDKQSDETLNDNTNLN